MGIWTDLNVLSSTAVTASLTSQAIMLNDQTADADFNALMLDNERSRNFKKVAYKNPKLQENLKHWLPIFDRCGLLDLQEGDNA